MKKLTNILSEINPLEIMGGKDILISGIAFDSRKVEHGYLFVATRGTLVDGHDFIPKTIECGACCIVCEEIPDNPNSSITYIKVNDSQESLGLIASKWYNKPSAKLKLIGITGTNGKTTTVSLLHTLFTELGYSCGLLSTIENKIDKQSFEATHTTPDAIQLNAFIAEMVNAGCSHCFIEVSSHALVQKRTAGLMFAGGVFTNLSHDHLDFHKTIPEYIKAKKSFFDELSKSAFALTNIDDKNGTVMLQNCIAQKHTYSIKNLADFKGRIIENQISGLHLQINEHDLYCRLVGQFNAYNLLAIYGTALLLGENEEEILPALSNLQSAAGRFDYQVSTDGIIAIIDYAHTPDALENVLDTINHIQSNDSKIITVVGTGGNRDKSKRPEMAIIAARLSNRLILTSDNPRFENPDTIINDMHSGLNEEQQKRCLQIINREEAIKTAFFLAQKGDIILIAGKGHENYQEINGIRYPFDDKDIINNLFKKTQ
ncbi:MAG: UDP-N-acetylmuramoyl-L-alanyl-D-glutamate--2,6-diaminopimelate ligase [Bacteroidales bacterium]|jgi:UDP-N-acetylmuramoyl-L-alanyl-D-glutamate--2,6-diaminopimelate ligase|nr:UDP-N-acetylmuramoyl-L-alanyl-D-glutamate--2,6-diaminopimelate ligase [Bacteroidales bacterium]